MNNLFISFFLTTLLILQGCSTAPIYGTAVRASDADLTAAQREIHAAMPPIPHYITDADAERQVYRIYGTLVPSAVKVCRYMGENANCSWDIQYSNNPAFNAYAAGTTRVVIHKGVLRYASTDEEVAVVIAHELAHHAANHIQEGITRAQTGIAIGAVVGALAGAYASRNGPVYDQTVIAAGGAMIGGALGEALAKMGFSSRQETEADYLAAYILLDAGYDVKTARNLLIIMAKVSGNTSTATTAFSSHPTPVNRLAEWDNILMEMRMDTDGLPNVSKTPSPSPSFGDGDED